MTDKKPDVNEEKIKEVIKVDDYELGGTETVEVTVPVNPNEKRIPFNKLGPLDKIRMVAAQQGVRTVSASPSCNSCYGRGYISQTVIKLPEGVSATEDRDVDEEGQTHLPNPCKCIFSKVDRPKFFTGSTFLNRSLTRKRDTIVSRQIVKSKSLDAKLSDKDKLLEIKKKKKRLKKLKNKIKKTQRNR